MPDLRASDADRDAAVEALRAHALAGRPAADELYKDRERITNDLDEDEHGTHLVATGIAPLAVRRAFAELED